MPYILAHGPHGGNQLAAQLLRELSAMISAPAITSIRRGSCFCLTSSGNSHMADAIFCSSCGARGISLAIAEIA